MKNIYDQTGLAPVSVSIRGGAPRLIMKLPCLLRDHNFEQSAVVTDRFFSGCAPLLTVNSHIGGFCFEREKIKKRQHFCPGGPTLRPG